LAQAHLQHPARSREALVCRVRVGRARTGPIVCSATVFRGSLTAVYAQKSTGLPAW